MVIRDLNGDSRQSVVAYAKMLLELHGSAAELCGWAEGCRCHEHESSGDQGDISSASAGGLPNTLAHDMSTCQHEST